MGVVTRFDLKTFKQGPFWGGVVGYDIKTREQHFKALEELNGASQYDVYASVIVSLAYSNGSWTIYNNYEYTKQPARAYPLFFKSFTNIQPELVNTMRVSPLGNLTAEIRDLGASAQNR